MESENLRVVSFLDKEVGAMKDPLFLSKTIKNQISYGDDLSERPSIRMIDLMSGMSRLAEKPLDPIGKAIQGAESAACVVYARSTDPSATSQWTGSGFLLPGGLIVTANHVIEPTPQSSGDVSVEVSFDGQTSYPAKMMGGDRDFDIAILKVPDDIPVRPVLLSNDPPIPGEIIATIGAPEGWANVVTVGRVSATNMTPSLPPDKSWTDMIFIDADILEGSSGSMVIDIKGQVIGSVMGIIGRHAADAGRGHNAVVSIEKIKGVISSILENVV